MELLTLASCTVDLERGRVHHRNGERTLTARELELLQYLVQRAGTTVSRDVLMREVFRYSEDVVSRSCDNAVRRLREKIEADPARPDHLVTAFGQGYRFVTLAAPETAAPPSPGSTPWSARILDLGEVQVDLDRARIISPRGEQELTANELSLLSVLAERGSMEREALAQKVWGNPSPRPLVNAVMRLRKKLEPDPAEPRLLVTTATGYTLQRVQLQEPSPPSDPLIGRVELLAELQQALAHPGRWVVLVGIGGIGKTRVARQVAASAGGCWVEAAGASSATELAFRIARAWGIPQTGDEDPVARLTRVLEHKSGLLVLDDLDSMDESARSALAGWVAASGKLRWLGTCRRRTRIPHEQVLEVPPLPTDDGERLFVARARALDPSFRSRPAERKLIRELCERVDGLPLAIALVACRAPVMGPRDLLEQMHLDLLADQGEQGPHASMRAVLQATVERLSPPDREALWALALFRSFDASDALALLGPGALDRLSSLRERSLLRCVGEEGSRRLSVWEVVRDYAREHEDPARVRRYLQHLARFGDESLRVRLEAQDGLLFDQLEAGLEDLVAAVELAAEKGEPLLAARCAIPLAYRFLTGGPYHRGVEVLQSVLALPGLPAELRPRLRSTLALLWLVLTRFEQATLAAAQAVQEARETGDTRSELWAEGVLANVASLGERDLATACVHWQRMATLAEQLGDELLGRWARAWLAEASGKKGQMRVELEQLVAAAPPEHPLVMSAARRLGERALVEQRLADARFWLEQASRHPLCQRFFVEWLDVQQELMGLHLATGDTEAMDQTVEETLSAIHDLGLHLNSAVLLMQHASSLLFRGEVAQAERRFEAARASFVRMPREAATGAYLDGRTAELAMATGDARTALQHVARALAWTRERGKVNSTAQHESLRGWALFSSGQLEEGLAVCEAACASIEEHPPRPRAIVTARLAMLRAMHGERARAHELRQAAWQLGREAGVTQLGSDVGWALHLMDQALGLGSAQSTGTDGP
jgi:DNA-binding response OmpR family regulator/tetratricopeptide (TPR) repeat protein